MVFGATACSGKSDSKQPAASSSATQSDVKPSPFDADSAFSYVAAQTAFGPRVPGTKAHAECVDYIVAMLRRAGGVVELQDTVMVNPKGEKVSVRNISARFRPEAPTSVLLAAHYDSRPRADMDPDEANHAKPIDGANDGASGVGVILELVRHIDRLPEGLGIEVAILDAEDNGDYESDDALWCIGSQAWAAHNASRVNLPLYGILLDMVGGRDARFHREYFSERYARQVLDHVWSAAQRAGYGDRFPQQTGGAINDDHIYIMQAGVPCIDIVESVNPSTGSFNPTWHTLDDTIENIDPATLKAVGDVVFEALAGMK